MNRANRSFYGLVTLAVFVAIALGVATTRILEPHVVNVGSRTDAIVRWCFNLVTGFPDIDELLLVALLGLLSVALVLGVSSLVRQCLATRSLLPAGSVPRLQRTPGRVTRLTEQIDLTSGVDVVRARQPYAFCYGLLRPRICLSTGLVHLLNDQELAAVLLHERYHVQNHDPLKIVLARALGHAFFFLPMIGELGRSYATTRELTADRAVIDAQGDGRWLASVLYKLVTQSSSTVEGPAAVVGLMTVTAERIDHLLDGREPEQHCLSSSAPLTSTFVLLAVASFLLSSGLVGVGIHDQSLAHRTVCPL